MKLVTTFTTTLTIVTIVITATSTPTASPTQVARLDEANWEEFVPAGKEVDAIYGDFVLRNQHLTAVIAQPRASRNANMTVRDVGGALIDLTTRANPSDQLSAFYPQGKGKFAFRELGVLDADGNQIDLSADQVQYSGDTAAVVVKSAGSTERPEVTVTYSLGKDDPTLAVTTEFQNGSSKPLTVTLSDDIRLDGGKDKEDIDKAPNGTAALFWIHDRFWKQAYGVEAPEMTIRSNSDSRNSVLTYLRDSDGKVTLEPGQRFAFTRHVFPAQNLISLRAIASKRRGLETYPVQLTLRDSLDRPIADAEIEARIGKRAVGSGRTDDAGVLTCELPAGEATFQARLYGQDIGAELPFTILEQSAVQEFELKVPFATGTVACRIVGEQGRGIPCKVEFQPRGNTRPLHFGPDSAEEGVRNLYYAAHGQFELPLPPGEYAVTISRGPEYDALEQDLQIEAGKTSTLEGTLRRTVHTPGWISSDFHSHSSPSGDNTSSQRGRVLNLLCEHIEFAPCTEHNRISTYDPHIAELGIGKFMSTVSGMELTGSPLPLNHQNVFPLIHRPRTQDGGAPVTDVNPERQIERVALWDNRSEKLIQQNHPDIGWLFFDRDGNGEPDEGFARSFAFMDVIEIHPIQNVLRLEPYESFQGRTGNNRIFNWLQLLNQGYRIFGVVNTDAHYNYHGSSSLRNWIQSPTDDPAEIKPMDVVHAAEQGHVIMSNGPYLEVVLTPSGSNERFVSGQDVPLPGGEATLHVKVQCANWVDVDRVVVLVNGRVHPDHHYTRKTHPRMFADGVVKFEHSLPLRLDQDAHVIVLTAHGSRTLGSIVGPSWGSAEPAALSNPIFLDVDGNGFVPNKDTLDAPLPVKYGTRS